MRQTQGGSQGGGRDADRPLRASACFAVVCRTAEERHSLNARYNAAYSVSEFGPRAGEPYGSRMTGLDTGTVRVLAMHDKGGLEGHTAWREDAFGAWFAWGSGADEQRFADTGPRLTVAGPGTELHVSQDGDVRSLRVSLRGEVLQQLRTAPTAPAVLERWLRPGIFRPRTDPAREWRLQQAILRCKTFAEHSARQGVNVAHALDVAAAEVTARLLEVLSDPREGGRLADNIPHSRRSLVELAVALLQAGEDAPVSVATVCRQLHVGERTLQRAFKETLGIGLRAYERERRLRGVHGAILAEGDRRTITEIAMSFGFWHLGRFAGAYAAMFGCSPSETRRRTWGDRR